MDPCHKLDKLNCLFCYCPLHFVRCPGHYTRLSDGRKDCMECTINHEPEFWETVQKIMKNPQPEDFRSMKKLSVEGYLALLDK